MTVPRHHRRLDELLATRLDRAFFARDALVVAEALVGGYLVHGVAPGGPRAARIVETEAYAGPGDGACHARFGLTERTRTLFGPAGHAYVFIVYGMHHCVNAVCRHEGAGHAVLVRAGEPLFGIEPGVRTDGPGRLARALRISRENDGDDLTEGSLFLSARTATPRIVVTPRVGVAYAGDDAERPWRFLDAASEHVSRPAARAIGLGRSVRRLG